MRLPISLLILLIFFAPVPASAGPEVRYASRVAATYCRPFA